MSTLLVKASALTRIYKTAAQDSPAAVRDASFEIHAGDRIALVGPSGSGKSTILHLLAGLDKPDGGEIVWPGLGERATLRPAFIALAFQGPSLLPPLNVVENVELPMLLQGTSQSEARVRAEEMIDRFNLTAVAAQFPEELSGGQAQRAGLARAVAARPRLLLADEPTGQQDRAGGINLLQTLLSCMDAIDGSSLVIATHDQTVADSLTSRWEMNGGRLTAVLASR
ncbi:MAG: ATP-binding cassette domain-containing protein [Actinomycetota bacterium]